MLIKRLTKGTPLTHAEVDSNFQYLQGLAETAQDRADSAFSNDATHYAEFLGLGPDLSALRDDINALEGRTDTLEGGAGTTASTLASLSTNLQLLLDEVTASFERKGLDAGGVYTIIEFKRKSGTLVKRSVLSGGASPEYTTRTETLYKVDGSVALTRVYALTYSGGQLISETWL